jgi:hypothetical protein
MTIVTFDEATEVPVVVPPGHDPESPPPTVRCFFGRMGVELPGPQAFLATLPAPTNVRAHFHRVDQFQLFLSESGCYYQRHELAPVVVHYADRYTTYGPFGSTRGELELLTLRAEHGAFTGFMPESRAELVQAPGRNLHVDVDHKDLRAGGSLVETLMAGRDGLAALVVRAGPDTTVELPLATTDLGEYHCVLTGTLVADGAEVGQSVGWYDRDDAPIHIQAGAAGLEMLVLRYPSTVRPTATQER